MAEQQLPFFVYGTLLPNQPNYFLFEDSIEAEQPAKLPNSQLYSRQFAPMLLEDVAGFVRGMVMSLSAETYPHILAKLDTLEGYDPQHPEQSLYQRVKRTVQLEDGTTVLAWVYIGLPEQVEGLTLIGSDWLVFSAENEERIAAWWRGEENESGDL